MNTEADRKDENVIHAWVHGRLVTGVRRRLEFRVYAGQSSPAFHV